MNFKNEINYRLLLIMISNLFENGEISKQERDRTIEKLIARFNPPIGIMERDAFEEDL